MRIISFITLLFFTNTSYAQLSDMFAQEAIYQHFNGVVLVKKGQEVYYEGCFGNNGDGVENSLETPFDIGSVSKQFTAAAILHLVQAGKIQLNDLINEHLGEYASDRWKKVTIRHLLTHTSGVPSLYQTEQGLETFFPEEFPIERKELISRFSDGKLLFTPGDEFNYSNSGYILLATIIEQVSGLPYDQYLAKTIFQPYGLENTSCARPTGAARPFYGFRSDLLKPAPLFHISWLIGAGGIYSTANDLSLWLETINRDDFLTKELREAYMGKHANAGSTAYGYGWQITKQNHIEHDGGSDGFTTFISFNPETKEQLVMLTNRGFKDIRLFGKSNEQIRSWADDVWTSLSGEKIEALPKIKSQKLIHLKYEMDNGQQVEFVPQDSVYNVQVSGGYPSRLMSNTPIEPAGAKANALVKAAEYLNKGKYWSFAKYCNGEMKFVSYSGLMAIGFRTIKNGVGELDEMIPYKLSESSGLIRLKGSEGEKDIIVYFDDEDKIMGVYNRSNYIKDQEQTMLAYPIGGNSFYLDGIPYGEPSAVFSISNSTLQLEQSERLIYGKLVK